jgi:pimeloyl-ACP methyl ester carboxylesterase
MFTMKFLLLALLLTTSAFASDCIFSEEKGSGPEAIVFVHDGLSTHRIWDAQWSHFGAKHHVVRYDRRGYGKSCAPTAKFSDMTDLENLLDARKVEKVIFIASSAGGDLALRYTIKHPERVKALVRGQRRQRISRFGLLPRDRRPQQRAQIETQ